jgi:hypothetical protein
VRSASRPNFLLDDDMVSFLSMEAGLTAPVTRLSPAPARVTSHEARDVAARDIVAVRRPSAGARRFGAPRYHFSIARVRPAAGARYHSPPSKRGYLE